jgi:Coenzyme PQQ synthesis protein D (PqqD)
MGETGARCFRVSPDVAARDIPEGVMLVNLQSGAAFKLNQVGAAVWNRLDGSCDVAAIVSDLAKHYRVEIATLELDVDALLRDLQQQALIERCDPL